MFIAVSNNDPIPLYEQIEKQIITQIVSGDLPAGYKMPSIRALAKEITISVITVKKAYELLEARGYITTRAGKESIVADTWVNMLKDERIEKMQQYFKAGILECKLYGMNDKEIVQKFTVILEGNEKNRSDNDE